MAVGFTEATKDQALVGQGIQVSLQGTDLALSRSVVGDVDNVELGLGDATELFRVYSKPKTQPNTLIRNWNGDICHFRGDHPHRYPKWHHGFWAICPNIAQNCKD